MNKKSIKRDVTRMREKTLDKQIALREKQVKLLALDNLLQRTDPGYTGASVTRRYQRNWNLPSGTADEMMLEDISLLRDRAQDLYRNSSVSRGIILNKTENVIGSGLKLQSTIDAEFLGMNRDQAEIFQRRVERKFHNTMKTREIDASRKMNFYALQELAFRNYQIDGEVFVLLPRFNRNKEKYSLKIQLIPANRCENPYAANDDLMREGIRRNERGEPVEYYFRKNEGYFTFPQEYAKIPAFGKKTGRPNVLHIFRPDFIGQSRGVPFITTVIEDIKNLDRFGKNELTNAAVSSLFTGFIKSNRDNALDPAFQTYGSDTIEEYAKDYTLQPGAVIQLDEGEDIEFANPSRPNSSFGAFMETYLMMIGMATGIPYEVLIKRFNSSFTASKAARIEAWRHYLSEREWFTRQFCDPIYEEWFTEALYLNEIDAPGYYENEDVKQAYLESEWFGDQQGYIDPTNEIQAALDKINNGLSTYTEEAAKNGTDFEKNVNMLAYEKRKLREAGVLNESNQ